MIAVDFEAFVGELATVSGDAIRPFFRTSLGIEDKSGGGAFDPVTAADRAAEQAMRTLIREKFPAHGIVGEEFGSERSDAEFVWVLDPIDGTKSFISGMPAWGTNLSSVSAFRAMASPQPTVARPVTAPSWCGPVRRSSMRFSTPRVRG